ncbi:MAG: hypothetical protein ACRC9U_00040 [Metamycoplasmataceae bacterium]
MYFREVQYSRGKFAIAANLEIMAGDIKEIDSFIYIKYTDEIIVNNTDNEEEKYHGIAFDNIDEEYAFLICNFFEKEYRKDKSLTLSKIVSNLSDLFRKLKEENNKNKYLGILAELLIIRKCQDEKIDIKDFYSYGENDKLDFHFPNKNNIEIKYGNKESKSFIVNYKQLEALSTKEKNELCVVFTEFDSKNGLNLIELLNSINNCKHRNLIIITDVIKQLELKSPNLFEEYKVNVENCDFIFIDKNYLPIINVKETNSLISANFKLFATEDMSLNFIKKIKGIIDEN